MYSLQMTWEVDSSRYASAMAWAGTSHSSASWGVDPSPGYIAETAADGYIRKIYFTNRPDYIPNGLNIPPEGRCVIVTKGKVVGIFPSS